MFKAVAKCGQPAAGFGIGSGRGGDDREALRTKERISGWRRRDLHELRKARNIHPMWRVTCCGIVPRGHKGRHAPFWLGRCGTRTRYWVHEPGSNDQVLSAVHQAALRTRAIRQRNSNAFKHLIGAGNRARSRPKRIAVSHRGGTSCGPARNAATRRQRVKIQAARSPILHNGAEREREHMWPRHPLRRGLKPNVFAEGAYSLPGEAVREHLLK